MKIPASHMNPKQHLSWDHDLAPVFFFWWGFGSGALVRFVVLSGLSLVSSLFT